MIYERIIKSFINAAGILIFLVAILSSPKWGLTPQSQKTIGIFFLTVSFWITGFVPPPVTGLLVLALIPLFNILPASQTFSLFGNRAIFFLLGVFIMSTSLMKTGLARKMALIMLNKLNNSYFKMLSGIFTVSFLMSLLMPEHAVAAMLFPVLIKFVHTLNINNYKFNSLIFLSMAWGCIAGGIGTPLGGARAPLAMELLYNNFGINLGFLKWTVYAFPASIMLYVLIVLYLYMLVKMNNLDELLTFQRFNTTTHLYPLSRQEKITFSVYILTLIAWMMSLKTADMAVIAILSSVSLFLLKIITWRDVEEHINWSIILMYGGAIVLGKTMVSSGAARWFADKILHNFVKSPFSFFWLFTTLTILFTEVMSNVAACAFLLPIAYGFVGTLEINPIFATFTVAIPSGLAFLLPMGSPPNAIAYSSGKYTILQSIKFGAVNIIFSLFVLYIIAKLFWGL